MPIHLPTYPKAYFAAARLRRERDRVFVAMPFGAPHSRALWRTTARPTSGILAGPPSGALRPSGSRLQESTSKEVREAVSRLAAEDGIPVVRDRASGILSLIEGALDPTDEVRRDLINLVLRQLDGGASVVIELAGPSSTWIGSVELEAIVRAGVTDAQRHFQAYFSTQGGIEEEAVTAQLVESIRGAIAGSASRFAVLSTASRRRLPRLEIGYRQVPKIEESEVGCDLGFLLTLRERARALLRVAEIVQVKKPVRVSARRSSFTPAGFADRWRIDREQLTKILAHSSSAVYWLIDPAGEVVTVPAKVLLLLSARSSRAGRAESRTFSVDYLGVRSAAVPLHQFLVDLLSGLWLGSCENELVSFASGEQRRTRPRIVLELIVDLAGEHEGNERRT